MSSLAEATVENQPTPGQWKKIAQVCVERNLFPVFDTAYQGFATGDFDKDVECIKYFTAHTGKEMAVLQSFTETMGLYNDPVGAVHIVCSGPGAA